MYIYTRCYKCNKVFDFNTPDFDRVNVCSLKFADRKMITDNLSDLFCRYYCIKCLEKEKKHIEEMD
jgi:hypothetical protein